uniref:Uncharacterized protein n=1 Tax=viral metagenome TaxID=1070528 RepID=A0A6C0C1M2_9ZZZZ
MSIEIPQNYRFDDAIIAEIDKKFSEIPTREQSKVDYNQEQEDYGPPVIRRHTVYDQAARNATGLPGDIQHRGISSVDLDLDQAVKSLVGKKISNT